MSAAIATPTDKAIVDAYSTTGAAWRDGPALVYDRLADTLVDHAPFPLRDASVIDIGAGTGAASSAAQRAGARSVVAVDAAAGMLVVDRAQRPPAVVADATRLPFAAQRFDVALAAFSFNHLADPVAGFAEAVRVVRRGGAVIASAYAADDRHPVKHAVDDALRTAGWSPPGWYADLQRERAPRLATVESCAAAVADLGVGASIVGVRVPFVDMSARQLVAWRLGMAQHAPFVAALAHTARRRVVHEAMARLGDPVEPLVRSIMVVTIRC